MCFPGLLACGHRTLGDPRTTSSCLQTHGRQWILKGDGQMSKMRFPYHVLRGIKTPDVVFDFQVPALSSQGQGCQFTQWAGRARAAGCEDKSKAQSWVAGSSPAGLGELGSMRIPWHKGHVLILSCHPVDVPSVLIAILSVCNLGLICVSPLFLWQLFPHTATDTTRGFVAPQVDMSGKHLLHAALCHPF